MRGQRRDLGVRDRLDDDRTISGQRAIPRRPDLLGAVDPNSLQTEKLCISRVVEVGQVLRPFELGVARHRALLPGDLVQVAVVEHEHDQSLVWPLIAVLGDRDQLVDAVHLHRPVADQRKHRPVGMGELCGDRVGDTGTHRRQRPRQGGHHPAADLDVPGEPVRRRSRVCAQDRAVGEAL